MKLALAAVTFVSVVAIAAPVLAQGRSKSDSANAPSWRQSQPQKGKSAQPRGPQSPGASQTVYGIDGRLIGSDPDPRIRQYMFLDSYSD
jgi:hypothetical protein